MAIISLDVILGRAELVGAHATHIELARNAGPGRDTPFKALGANVAHELGIP